MGACISLIHGQVKNANPVSNTFCKRSVLLSFGKLFHSVLLFRPNGMLKFWYHVTAIGVKKILPNRALFLTDPIVENLLISIIQLDKLGFIMLLS
jgi:hypothetical protein